MGAVINVENLTKTYRVPQPRSGLVGGTLDLFARRYRLIDALKDVSFQVEPGEVIGYLGPNGAGKSTTLKILTGVLVPTDGRVEVNGFLPHRQRASYVRTIGVVFGHRTQLWWDLPAMESFRMLQAIYEIDQEVYQARLDWLNEVLDLKPLLTQPVRSLSLGQRTRCNIAASLLHNPRLLFLDEPTIGLDAVAKLNIRDFIREINSQYGTTIFLASHDLTDVQELCQRVMIIDHGQKIYDGPFSLLRNTLGRKRRVCFDLAVPLDAAQLEGLAGNHLVQARIIDRYKLECTFDSQQVRVLSVIQRVSDAVLVNDIHIVETSIEEIVSDIYQNGIPASLNQAREQN